MLRQLIPPSLVRLPSERETTRKQYWLGHNPGKYPFARRTLELAGQKGQGLVELAIVIPLLLVIAVGALDLGRIFFSVITVTNISREGARYLTLHPEDRLFVLDDPDTNPICYDLDVTPPEPKPQYFCTYAAARQEAEGTGVPVVDPNDVTITASCPPGDDGICAKGSMATVTAVYVFSPITLWYFEQEYEIIRTTQMMVP